MDIKNEILKRVYSLDGPDQCENLYDDWAASYDKDTTEDMGYVAPELCARRLTEFVSTDAVILDAGCGTGLAGDWLVKLGFKTFDGLDVSQKMLDLAEKKGIYRSLGKADLTKPMDIADDTYDGVLCVGTLTHGHVGPNAVDELIRVAKPGAPVIATIHEGVWESEGFRAHVEGLEPRGLAKVLSTKQEPYHAKEGINCHLCVFQKL